MDTSVGNLSGKELSDRYSLAHHPRNDDDSVEQTWYLQCMSCDSAALLPIVVNNLVFCNDNCSIAYTAPPSEAHADVDEDS
jgi:hypothetical protein